MIRLTAADDGMPEAYVERYGGCAPVGGVFYIAALTGSAQPYPNCPNRFACQAVGCEHNKCTPPSQGPYLPAAAENDVEKFIRMVLPHVAGRFVLVTALGDNRMPADVVNADKLLASLFLVRWYCQNMGGFIHPKLFPLPIGFYYHRGHHWQPGAAAFDPAAQIPERSTAPRTIGTVLVDSWEPTSHPSRGTVCGPACHEAGWNETDLAKVVAHSCLPKHAVVEAKRTKRKFDLVRQLICWDSTAPAHPRASQRGMLSTWI